MRDPGTTRLVDGRGDVPCVVVTGRTAQDVKRALDLFDVWNWVSDPEEADHA